MTWSLAQVTDPGGVADFLQFGVAGLVVIALILGWLWPKPSVEQLRADKAAAEQRAQRAEQQRDALAQELQSSLSVLTETTTACRRMLPLLQEILEDERSHRRTPDHHRDRPDTWGGNGGR